MLVIAIGVIVKESCIWDSNIVYFQDNSAVLRIIGESLKSLFNNNAY